MEVKNILDIFKGEEINRTLFSLLKSTDDLTVRSSLEILNALYTKFPFFVAKKVASSGEEDEFTKNYLTSSSETEEQEILPYIDSLLKEELEYFFDIFREGVTFSLEQQYGEVIKPFGATKLNATKFISNIIAVGNQDYALILAPCLFPLLSYATEFPWNSLLHNCIEMIFRDIFKTNSKYNDEVRTAVIAETGLTEFITNCAVNLKMKDSGRTIRNGLIATVISIANILNSHKSEYVQEELNKSEEWIEFVNTELKYANENDEKALAGHQSKAEDSDEESANYETSMDKLFTAFTNLKESHDSSRELDNSDDEEEEEVDTENILKDIDSPSEDSDKHIEETKEQASGSEGEIRIEAKKKTSLLSMIPAKQEEEQMDEDNQFYDTSYWSLPTNIDLDKLLQDS